MTNYKSNYTGAEIDAGIAKANTALQTHQTLKTINNESLIGEGDVNLNLYYPAQYDKLPTPSQQYVGQIIQYMGENIVINDENFYKGDFCLGDVYDSAELVYFWTNLTQQRLYPYALQADVLKMDNTYPYTPTNNYNPATKKYVDDSIKSAITDKLGGSY